MKPTPKQKRGRKSLGLTHLEMQLRIRQQTAIAARKIRAEQEAAAERDGYDGASAALYAWRKGHARLVSC
jgi:hypothetical protein